MINLSSAEKIQAARSSFCLLIQSPDRFFYIIIPATEILAFRDEISSGKVDLARYGQVVAQGAGTPSRNIMKQMTEFYGCNHDNAMVML